MSDYKWTMWQFENVYHDTHLGYEGHFVRPRSSSAVQKRIAQINTSNIDGSEKILAKHHDALERAANTCINDSFFVNESDVDAPYRRPKSRATDFRKMEGDEFTPVVKAIMLTCAADAKKEKRATTAPEPQVDDVDRDMKLLLKKRVDVHQQDRGKKFIRTYDRSHKVNTKTLLKQHFRPSKGLPKHTTPTTPTSSRRSKPLVSRGRHIKHQPTDTDSDSEESINNKVDEFMHAVEQKQQQKAMTLLKDKFQSRRRKALLGPSAATAEDNNDIILGKEHNLYKKIDVTKLPTPPPTEAPRSQDKSFAAATMFIQRVLQSNRNAVTNTTAPTVTMESLQTRTSPVPVETVESSATAPSPITVPTFNPAITPQIAESPEPMPITHFPEEEESEGKEETESPVDWLVKRMEQVRASMQENSAENTIDDMMNIRILSVEISLLFKGFQYLDEHSDGFLSASDLRNYCIKYHVNLTRSVIEKIMWLMDDARRGYVTFEEIKNFFLQFRGDFHESGLEFASVTSLSEVVEEKLPGMQESNIHAHPLLLFRILFFASMQDGDGCIHLLSAYQMLVQLFGGNAEKEFNCIFLKYFHNITDSDRISIRHYVAHIVERQNINAHLKLKKTHSLGHSFEKKAFRRSNKMTRKVVVQERRKAIVPYSSFSSDA